MALREKSAWISFWTTLIVYGAYFAYVGQAAAAGRPVGFAGPLTTCIFVLVVLQVGLQIVDGRPDPRAARPAGRARAADRPDRRRPEPSTFCRWRRWARR
jgi:hypothetical protein